MMIQRCAALLVLLALPAIAVAAATNQVPEPETLALLAVGAVAIVVARWRRK
jgi:hypothetical protein